MIAITVNNNTHIIKTTLGVVRKVEATAKKSLTEILSSAGTLAVDDMLIYISLGADDPKAFISDAYEDEELGHQGVFDKFVEYIYAMRYPTMKKEEAEEYEAKKILETEKRASELLGLQETKD